jgi:hypothetical protein
MDKLGLRQASMSIKYPKLVKRKGIKLVHSFPVAGISKLFVFLEFKSQLASAS